MIRYQDRLVNTLNSLENLPHSVLLLGDVGAGHDDVCEHISSLFNLVMYKIQDTISNEYVDEILSSKTKSLYCLDMSTLSVREQNIILKLYEEPSEYVYIVLNSSYGDYVLDTIKSRSYELKFDRYSDEQLIEYMNADVVSTPVKDLVLDICTTPGLVEISNHTDMTGLFSLCSKMISSMKTANFQNAMSISNKINYSDSYDKYDLNLFIKMLKYVILNSDINDKKYVYDIVKKNLEHISSMNNKQQAIEHMIIELWRYFKN